MGWLSISIGQLRLTVLTQPFIFFCEHGLKSCTPVVPLAHTHYTIWQCRAWLIIVYLLTPPLTIHFTAHTTVLTTLQATPPVQFTAQKVLAWPHEGRSTRQLSYHWDAETGDQQAEVKVERCSCQETITYRQTTSCQLWYYKCAIKVYSLTIIIVYTLCFSKKLTAPLWQWQWQLITSKYPQKLCFVGILPCGNFNP